jgi:hypothetical protein
MTRYYAMVRFNTVEFEAENEDEAEGRVQELLDQLGATDTEISWDDADYIIYEEGEN